MTEFKPPAPGVRVARRYRLELRQTGWGAGDVWRAVDLDAGSKRVCLKFLPQVDEGGEDEASERFDALVASLTELKHPNVLPVTGGGTHLGQHFLVAEFHQGESLRTQLDRAVAAKRAPDPGAVWKLFEKICQGVRAAHLAVASGAGPARGSMVHGGLAPECVRLRAVPGGEPDVLVTDFGLWSLCSDESLRKAAAPEQRGGAGDATPAVDVFALGLMLVEMLVPGVRARPEWGGIVRGITPAREDEGRALLRELRADVYGSVWGAVARATQRLPEMRYGNAGRLLDVLATVRWAARAEGADDDELAPEAQSTRPPAPEAVPAPAPAPAPDPEPAPAPAPEPAASPSEDTPQGSNATPESPSEPVAATDAPPAQEPSLPSFALPRFDRANEVTHIFELPADAPAEPELEPGDAPPTERPPAPSVPAPALSMAVARTPWADEHTTVEAFVPPPDPTLMELDDEAADESEESPEQDGETAEFPAARASEETHHELEAPPPDQRFAQTYIGPAPDDGGAGAARDGEHSREDGSDDGDAVGGEDGGRAREHAERSRNVARVLSPLTALRWCIAHPAVEAERARRMSRFYALANDRERWAEVARAYLELAGRISGAGERATEFELWSRLAEIYRGPLHNPAAATDALRVALRLRPDDSETLHALRALQRAAHEADERAAGLRASFARNPADATPLVALCELYDGAGATDRAFCAAAGATLLMGAGAPERVRAVYRGLRPKRLLFPRGPLDATQVTQLLLHSDADPAVGELFAALLPAVRAILATPLDAALGPDDEVCDPATSPAPPVHALDLAARMYDLPEAPTIVRRGAQTEGYAQLGTEPPAVGVGERALANVTSAELRFLAGRALLESLPEFAPRALCRAGGDEPAVFAFAALGLASPGAEAWGPPARTAAAREALAAYFADAPAAWGPVEHAARRVLAAPAPPDLARWSRGVDLTAHRAGLLLAGDLPACARVLAAPDAHPDAPRDLVVYSVSDAYAQLREELGLAIGGGA